MKVVVDASFWDVFPEGQISLLFFDGLDNRVVAEKEAYFSEMLAEASQKARVHIQEDPFTQNPVIQDWRQAFTQFKTKKGARSSIEALLKRVSQGREFSPINPLVDIYNAVSLAYGVPCGGEDIDKIVGDLHLGKAKGGEAFFPLGAEEDAPALPEELIYYDGVGAICRNLNWREAQRTMLTEETSRAVLVIEAVTASQHEQARAAAQALYDDISAYFNVTGTIHHLTIGNPEAEE